jgi:hypothetical protein
MSRQRIAPELPNFVPRVLARLDEAKRQGLARAGRPLHVNVAHDAWCALLRGTGVCDCDPDVSPVYSLPRSENN